MDIANFTGLCKSLCQAGPESANQVLGWMESMPVFVELMGEVNPATVVKSATSEGDEKWQLRVTRQLKPELESGFAIPIGTVGNVHGQVVRWNFRFSAFRFNFRLMTCFINLTYLI